MDSINSNSRKGFLRSSLAHDDFHVNSLTDAEKKFSDTCHLKQTEKSDDVKALSDFADSKETSAYSFELKEEILKRNWN